MNNARLFLAFIFLEARFHDCINKKSNNLKVAQCNGNGDIKGSFSIKVYWLLSGTRMRWVNILLHHLMDGSQTANKFNWLNQCQFVLTLKTSLFSRKHLIAHQHFFTLFSFLTSVLACKKEVLSKTKNIKNFDLNFLPFSHFWRPNRLVGHRQEREKQACNKLALSTNHPAVKFIFQKYFFFKNIFFISVFFTHMFKRKLGRGRISRLQQAGFVHVSSCSAVYFPSCIFPKCFFTSLVLTHVFFKS